MTDLTPEGYFPARPVIQDSARHHLGHAIRKLLLLYAASYALCFGMEGAMRWKYGVGSVTAFEKAFPQRGPQAKALVARQKLIDRMNDDPIYDTYLCIVFFGAPIALVAMMIHEIRLVNRLMRRIWYPLRWLVICFVAMMCSGLMMVLGPFIGAQKFYDVTSPAELIAKLR